MGQSENPTKGVPSAIKRSPPPGRPRKLGRAFEEELRLQPTELDRQRMAEAIGCRLDEVPDYFTTKAEMLVWRGWMGVTAGSLDWAREFMDRMSPKPRRTEVSGPGGGPLRGHISHGAPSTAEEAAAEEFYRGLARHDADDDDPIAEED